MNDKQRLMVVVGAGSFMVFIITIFGLGFSPVYKLMDTTEINLQYEKSNVDLDSKEKWYEWAEELKKRKRYTTNESWASVTFQ